MAGSQEDDNTQTHMALTSGTVVGHYKIISKIGAGGMGEVYLAEDTELDRKVALKFLPSRMCQDEDCRARFKREAQAAAKLKHPNIVTIYEVSEYRGRPFFAMEHCEGQSLRESIRTDDLSIDKIFDLAQQMCEGLDKAHRAGIIHRDIKPSNIVVDSDGRPKLLDFGLAAVSGSEKLTKTGSTQGTVGYMSPEQIEGKEVDQRSDLFSLGVVLYEMIAGRLPFKGDTETATLNSVLNDTAEPLSRYKADVPQGLQLIVNKALDKNCTTRYQHADEILADLRRLAESSRLNHSNDVIGQRSGSIRSRWRVVVISLAVIAIAIVAVALMWPDSSPDLSEQRVAVAVFKNQTGEESLDHIGHMAADWIGQGLAQTSLVAVVPPMMADMASEELEGPDGIQRFADATGARIVVSGSYYQQGDTLLFQAQVTDAEKSELLHALKPVRGPVEDPVALIELLRQRLMGTLATFLDTRLNLFMDASVDPPMYSAYTEFLRGMEKFRKVDMRAAQSHYYRAFAVDSTFGEALFMAALSHMNLGETALADSVASEVRKLEDRLIPISRRALDWMQAFIRGDRVGALSACRSSKELAPGTPMHMQLGIEALWLNHLDEAIEAMTSIDPQGPTMRGWQPYWGMLSRAYHEAGDRDGEQKAIDEWHEQYPGTVRSLETEIRLFAALGQTDSIQRCLETSLSMPDSPILLTSGSLMLLAGTELRCHGYREASVGFIQDAIDWYSSNQPIDSIGLASALYVAEEWEDALRLFSALHEGNPDNVTFLGYLGALAVRMGSDSETERISELLKNVQSPYVHGEHTFWLAAMEALKGHKEEAVALLRQALSEGQIYTDLHADLDLESLRGYPSYETLVTPKPMEK